MYTYMYTYNMHLTLDYGDNESMIKVIVTFRVDTILRNEALEIAVSETLTVTNTFLFKRERDKVFCATARVL